MEKFPKKQNHKGFRIVFFLSTLLTTTDCMVHGRSLQDIFLVQIQFEAYSILSTGAILKMLDFA